MPFWRTWAYPYSSDRERQRSHARSASVVSFSQGAAGQITSRRVIWSRFVWYALVYRVGSGSRGQRVPPPRLSPLPIIGGGQRPYHPLQVGSIDVLLTILVDLPGLGAVGVGNTVDPLNPIGLQHQGRFGDQHRGRL
jgi:hypothetical protein